MDAVTLAARKYPRRFSILAALLAVPLVSVVLCPSPAGAQEACGDKQCGQGTTCATYVKDCVPCVDGESSCGDCEPETLFYCASAACESAADCASHMACVASPRLDCQGTYPSCVDGEGDEQCSARVAEWHTENCQTSAPLTCTPRWSLPCQADTDCGDKFRCDGGACTLIEESCTEDADCPVTWFCASINVGPCYPVPGGGIDECVYEQPPIHGCAEPIFVVRESVSSDEAASGERAAAAAPAPSPSDEANQGCSVGGARSDLGRSGLPGLLALVLLRAGRVLQRRSAASR